MHLSVQVNLNSSGSTVWAVSDRLKQSLFQPVWGKQCPFGIFLFCFLVFISNVYLSLSAQKLNSGKA